MPTACATIPGASACAQQEAAAQAGTEGPSASKPVAAADGQADGEGGEGGAAARRRLQRRHLLQALRALRLVLDASPRLLGLLATKPAVDPLLECLRPACTAGLPGGAVWAASAGAVTGGEAAAATLAAAPPAWAAAGLPPGGGAELAGAGLEEAELALEVLLRLTAHAGGHTRQEDGAHVRRAQPSCDARMRAEAGCRLLATNMACSDAGIPPRCDVLCSPAGCVEALSQDKCIAQGFWLAYRAPSTGAGHSSQHSRGAGCGPAGTACRT